MPFFCCSIEGDPPAALWTARSTARDGILGTRPFTPLARDKWTRVLLAHIREMDALRARHVELGRPAPPASSGGGAVDAAASGTPTRPFDPLSRRQQKIAATAAAKAKAKAQQA